MIKSLFYFTMFSLLQLPGKKEFVLFTRVLTVLLMTGAA
jgi:hypothetical protein